MRHATRLSLSLALLVVFAAAFERARAADEPGVILDHKTLYMAPKIGSAHRFELQGKIGGAVGMGTFVIDKNECSLNEFGDRERCTEIAVRPIPVTFTKLRLADPSMQDRDIYSISGPNVPDEYHFWLVVGRKSKPLVMRLVVESAQKRSAFPLVPAIEFDKIK